MKINRLFLKTGCKQHFSEDVDFSYLNFDSQHCKNIISCHVDVDALELENVLYVDVTGTAEVVTSCSYTLDDINLKIKFNDNFVFTDDETDDSSIFEKGPEIDLNPYILGLLLDEIPHIITKPGSKLPASGVGYRVLTEDELNKEKQSSSDPRWSALDNIDID